MRVVHDGRYLDRIVFRSTCGLGLSGAASLEKEERVHMWGPGRGERSAFTSLCAAERTIASRRMA